MNGRLLRSWRYSINLPLSLDGKHRRVVPVEILISTGVDKPQEVCGRVPSEILREPDGSTCGSKTSFAFGTQVAFGRAT